jgi:DNA-binding NtrC family response regulator
MKWRALVVDDEDAIAATTAAIPETDGFEAETASSARQAKQMLAASPYDLVITDLKMETETAGFEVAEFASKQPIRPVVIMVSAYAALGAEWQSHRIDSFFQKPTNTAALLAAIARLLTKRALKTAA